MLFARRENYQSIASENRLITGLGLAELPQLQR
jgi:hypothetical protein